MCVNGFQSGYTCGGGKEGGRDEGREGGRVNGFMCVFGMLAPSLQLIHSSWMNKLTSC